MATLKDGARLGPYEILGALGAGGMGEVYRARDLRLNREVAIKCISSAVSGDAASRARIEREARSVAGLAHPNICALHDVGVHENVTFLVMELLHGETLADRLARAPRGLRTNDALLIASQVADALACAHRSGIVHRDLKPANVMLTPSGAKLLDFGLAKSPPRDATAETKTQSLVTGRHEIVGTLYYMAPEQLEGRADERSDIFALGAILFEMLTGTRAFAGNSSAAVIAAIISHDPPRIDGLRPEVPAGVARITTRCMAKDPDRRWQSAVDLADELRWLAEPSPATRPTPPRVPYRVIAAIALIATVAAAIVAMAWPLRVTGSRSPTHLAFAVPEGILFSAYGSSIAISPDGSTIAFAATIGAGGGATRHLFVKRLSGPDIELIPGTEDALFPFFSPDGQSVAFFGAQKLRRWSSLTRSVSTIADVRGYANGSPASWGPDDTILFGVLGDRPTQGINRVRASGGPIETLTRPANDKGEQTHSGPRQLANGTVLFTIRRNGPSGPEFDVAALTKSGPIVTVVRGASLFDQVGDRQLVYQNGHSLLIATFDPASLTVSNPQPLTDAVNLSASAAAEWAIGGDVLAYWAIDSPRRRLAWVDRTGASTPIGLPARNYGTPALSPAGDRLAVAVQRDTAADLWISDLRQQTLTQVTRDADVAFPVWSRDGSKLFATRVKGAAREITVQPADRPSAATSILDTGEQLFCADVSPDQRLLVVMKPTNNDREIWLMNQDNGQLQPIVQHQGTTYGGRLSPDGKWMSYFAQNAGDRFELFVTPFPNGGPRWQISRDGAREATWSRDGSELFYRIADRVMAAKIKPGATFDWEPPRLLFSGAYYSQGGPGVVQYDVAADGRFLMIEEVPLGSPTINVVLGWQHLTR